MKLKEKAKLKFDTRTAYTDAEWNQIKQNLKNTIFPDFIAGVVIKAAEQGELQVALTNAFKNCLMLYSSTLPTPIPQSKVEKIMADKFSGFNALLQGWLESEGLIVTQTNGHLIVSGWA